MSQKGNSGPFRPPPPPRVSSPRLTLSRFNLVLKVRSNTRRQRLSLRSSAARINRLRILSCAEASVGSGGNHPSQRALPQRTRFARAVRTIAGTADAAPGVRKETVYGTSTAGRSASACSRPTPPIHPPHAGASDGAEFRDSHLLIPTQLRCQRDARFVSVDRLAWDVSDRTGGIRKPELLATKATKPGWNGWATFSELVALDVEDLDFDAARGLKIMIGKSKSDHDQAGAQVACRTRAREPNARSARSWRWLPGRRDPTAAPCSGRCAAATVMAAGS